MGWTSVLSTDIENAQGVNVFLIRLNLSLVPKGAQLQKLWFCCVTELRKIVTKPSANHGSIYKKEVLKMQTTRKSILKEIPMKTKW